MGIKDAVLTTVEVLGVGDLVCEIGRYDLTIKPEGHEAIKDIGKYVVIWKRSEEGSGSSTLISGTRADLPHKSR